MLSDHTKAIIKSTAPVLQKHGKEITARMYQIAFAERPEYKRFFENTWMKHPLDGGPQPARLAEAVCAYAQNIDNLDALKGPLEHIAHKHTNTRVIAEQYPVIGACLLQAIKDVLGDAATPEVMTAWGEAYNFLADVLIKREREIYREEDAQMIAAARK